jgi:hypothetical protein
MVTQRRKLMIASMRGQEK